MRIATRSVLCALSACLTADAVADAERTHSLQVGATAATVAVSESGNGRASLRLPALEFVFRLRPVCAEPFRAGSISLTVADSRQTLDAEQLEDGTAESELRLTVPASQIAPVPVTDFCSAEPDDPDKDSSAQRGESLTLPAALSANASLLCVTESEREIVYTTAPLDVTLVCGSVDETAE